MTYFRVTTRSEVLHTVFVEAENMGEACKMATNYVRLGKASPHRPPGSVYFTELKAEKLENKPSILTEVVR